MTSSTTGNQTGPLTAPLTAVRDVVAAYRTCELATVGRDGVPVAWPAVCVVAPGDGALTLTTSIALPVKALNVRRDPRVALLFSDPTGTGRDDLPQVLVRGTATCPDEIRTSPAGLEDYWLTLWQRQPESVPTSPRGLRDLMDFYYLRLVLTVTPHDVTTLAPLRRPADAAASRGRAGRAGGVEARIAAHPDAVLTTMTVGGPPRPVRVRTAVDRATGGLVVTPVDGGTLDGVPDGPVAANLLVHGHDERLGALRQAAVVGRLDGAGATRAFTVVRTLGAPVPSSPWQMLGTVRRLRRTARRYLERRGLPRPRVAWDEYGALKARARAVRG